jgi:hypothetical protein
VPERSSTGQHGCDSDCCDFCVHYAFNGDEHGIYLNKGMCQHPDHPRPSDPGDGCEDFECEVCARAEAAR